MSSSQNILDEVEAQGGVVSPFEPGTLHNKDGDCVEIYLANECFFAKRLDGWFTCHIGEDSGEIVGGVLKGIDELFKKYPGISIEFDGNKISVDALLRLPAHETTDQENLKMYKDIISKSKNLKAELEYA